MINYKHLQTGDEIEFARKQPHWFTNVVANSEKLEIGKRYNISKFEVASSWVCVYLEGFGKDQFCLGSFCWPKCDCGVEGTWYYMAAEGSENAYYCEKCVPRGCYCNHKTLPQFCKDQESGVHPPEGSLWKWIDKEEGVWTNLDKNQQEYPCCEYEMTAAHPDYVFPDKFTQYLNSGV